jgi:formylglycine-generating enzyme required for sulfatase activity
LIEVTNDQFANFEGEAADASLFTNPQQPRVIVTWFEARDFCALRDARLPTEAEWEYVARGPDGLVFPWSDEFIEANVVFVDNSDEQPADVGSRPGGISWVGTLDMAGNAGEWTSSLYQPYPFDAEDGRESLYDRVNDRVLRGGAWHTPSRIVRAAYRFLNGPEHRDSAIGLRCVRPYMAGDVE